MMTTLQVSSLARSVVLGRRSVDTEVTASKTGRFGKKLERQAHHQWQAFENGGLGANVVDAQKGVGLDLTIDPCCAACGLSVSVASEKTKNEKKGKHDKKKKEKRNKRNETRKKKKEQTWKNEKMKNEEKDANFLTKSKDCCHRHKKQNRRTTTKILLAENTFCGLSSV